MKYQVIYFSRKGSTKKIANAIASELGIEGEDVKKAQLNENAFVFLGSGCYGGKPGKHLTEFIQKNDFSSNNVALFGTSGSGEGAEVNAIEELLKTKDVTIKGKYFCKGKFWFSNRDNPNEKEINDAKKFAKELKKTC